MIFSFYKEHTCTLFCVAVAAICWNASQASSAEILIDPGHSPLSPGAIGCSGKTEYSYNAELASKIATHLQKLGFKTSMTKGLDSEICLPKRTLKSKGKDLFLSIHHDSVQPQFLVSKSGKGACSPKAQGFSIFVSRKNRFFKESLDYAHKLGTELVRRGLLPTLHHAENIAGENRYLYDPVLGIYFFDDLMVLKSAQSPAILFEAAVIVNPIDEKRAALAEYQNTIVESIGKMLVVE
jgi:N-acetylmuramoyl-L-alanine amidase